MGICASEEAPASVPTVSGIVHMANIGDVAFSNSQFGGSKGQSTALEGFSLQLNGAFDVGIEYMAHAANVGDLPWTGNGAFCGSRGESRRIEGIAIRLTGGRAGAYSLHYRVHMAGKGDSAIATSGQYCGTKGESRAIEGIHVWLQANNYAPPVAALPSVNTLVHMSGVGDVRTTGSVFSGSKGESRQLEGFELTVSGADGVGLEYMCHAANVGDMAWVSSGQFQGSRGQSRQIEGIAVRAVGPNAGLYNVNYRVHMANVGDSAVATNGEYCGSRGQGRQIEGIHVWFTRR